MSVLRTGKSGKKYQVVLDPPKPPDKVETYRVLGQGSFGRVLLGKDEDGKYVAIKEVVGYSKRRNQLDREIGIAEHLGCQHKNIACLVDVAVIGVSTMWIITEYIEGVDMFFLDKKFKDDILWYLNIADQLVDGLDYMHRKGVAHRDIKPANIILRGPVPIYIDFDMACIRGSEMYPCKGNVGSPYFISPENWWLDPCIDYFKSDIYSLGVTFYYIFNDMKYPFDAETKEELAHKVLETEPVRSDSGIPELDDLVMNMLSNYQAERPSLDKIKIELTKLLKSTYGDPITNQNINGEFDVLDAVGLDKLELNDPFDDYI